MYYYNDNIWSYNQAQSLDKVEAAAWVLYEEETKKIKATYIISMNIARAFYKSSADSDEFLARLDPIPRWADYTKAQALYPAGCNIVIGPNWQNIASAITSTILCVTC